MKPLARLALGCGIATLLGAAGYYAALAEPLQALANREQGLVRLQNSVDEAQRIAGQEERLAMLNRRLRRATGEVEADSAPHSFATTLAQVSRRVAETGGAISGIYPQDNRQACGFKIIVPARDAVATLRRLEETLAWQVARLEIGRTADGRLEMYVLLECGA